MNPRIKNRVQNALYWPRTLIVVAGVLAHPAWAWQNNRMEIVKAVKVTYATRWTPNLNFFLGQQGLPTTDMPECSMVKAVVGGDVNTIDLLVRAGMDIDEPICLYERPSMGSRPSFREVHTGQVDISRRFLGIVQTTSMPFVPVRSSIIPNKLWVGLPGNIREPGVLFTLGGGSASYTLFGTPLMIACRMRNKHMVKLLLERYQANPNILIEQTSSAGTRPYYSALRALFGPANGSFDPPSNEEEGKIRDIIGMLCNAGLCLAPEDGRNRNALWDALEDASVIEFGMALRYYNVNSTDTSEKPFVQYLNEYVAASMAMPNGRYVKKACLDMMDMLQRTRRL